MQGTISLIIVGAFVISTGLQVTGLGDLAGLGVGGGAGKDGIGLGAKVELLGIEGGAGIGLGKKGLNAHGYLKFKHGGKGLPGISPAPGLNVTLPDLNVTLSTAGTTLPDEESVETDTPSPGPSTPTPEAITLEVTPPGATCNQTECEIECVEEKGHLKSFAKCKPNEQTGTCRCSGAACLPKPCFQSCLDQEYQKGYCKIFPKTGRHCYCFGCRPTDCYNSCRRGGQPRGYCKNFGKDKNGILDLKCICYGNKRDEPYPITTAEPQLSTPDVIGNVPVPTNSTS